MSNPDKLVVPKALDAKIIETFGRLARDFDGKAHIRVPGIGSLNFNSQEHMSLIEEIRTGDGTVVTNAFATFNGMTVNYCRDDAAAGVFDTIEVKTPSNQPKPSLSVQQRLELLKIVSNAFAPTDIAIELASANAEAAATVSAQQQATLDRLTAAYTTQQERLAAFQENAVHQLKKDREDLEQRYQERQTELEQWSHDRDLEVAKRASELDAREAELNNQSNTHERRELRNRLQETIRDRTSDFKLSQPTLRLKLPIHFVVAVSALVICVLIGLSTQALLDALSAANIENTALIIMSLRVLGLAAGLAAIIWFYLRWLTNAYAQAAAGETKLRQLQLDIDRASWAVEAALEWRNATDADLPEHLLQRITHNLFETGETNRESDRTAADELASALVGSAAKVELQAMGQKLEIDKPRKLQHKKWPVNCHSRRRPHPPVEGQQQPVRTTYRTRLAQHLPLRSEL